MTLTPLQPAKFKNFLADKKKNEIIEKSNNLLFPEFSTKAKQEKINNLFQVATSEKKVKKKKKKI